MVTEQWPLIQTSMDEGQLVIVGNEVEYCFERKNDGRM